MTNNIDIDEPSVEAVAEEFVKNHNSVEIAQELVKYSNSVDSLRSQLEYERSRNYDLAGKLDIVEKFISEHVKDNDEASVDELKELATELGLTLRKQVRIQFTVEYDLTVECDLEDEVKDTDFSVSMSYDGVGDLVDESEDWSVVEIEDVE